MTVIPTATDAPIPPIEPLGSRLAALRSLWQVEGILLDSPRKRIMDPEFAATRILDANANRAGEGLRVVEEYLRFGLEDSILSETTKRLRHDLTAALQQPELVARWRSRDSAGDVGSEIATAAERTRSGPDAVARASLQRVAQALRCLEEYSKTLGLLGEDFERLRYRLYDLEAAIERLRDSQLRLADCRLYVLVDGLEHEGDFVARVESMLDGGVDAIQLRDKRLDDRELLGRAEVLRRATAGRALMFINDRTDLAAISDADGVHLGQDDAPVAAARRLLKPHQMIGVSTHNPTQLAEAVAVGAAYAGCGPTFPSETKSFEQFAGLDYLRAAAKSTGLPLFAIGGINADNISDVCSVGVDRVAVSGAVWRADDPASAASTLRAKLVGSRND